jgi:hypothetical protein
MRPPDLEPDDLHKPLVSVLCARPLSEVDHLAAYVR